MFLQSIFANFITELYLWGNVQRAQDRRSSLLSRTTHPLWRSCPEQIVTGTMQTLMCRFRCRGIFGGSTKEEGTDVEVSGYHRHQYAAWLRGGKGTEAALGLGTLHVWRPASSWKQRRQIWEQQAIFF